MTPNLLEATKTYWRKLDELEAAYHRGELSLEEVDARVADLMTELGQERRSALRFFASGVSRFWQEQPEIIVGVASIGALVYLWSNTLS